MNKILSNRRINLNIDWLIDWLIEKKIDGLMPSIVIERLKNWYTDSKQDWWTKILIDERLIWLIDKLKERQTDRPIEYIIRDSSLD